MDYLTNYYKNLSEQLQEQLATLTEQIQMLNEIGDTPAGRDALTKLKMKAAIKAHQTGKNLDQVINRMSLRQMGKGTKEGMAEVLKDQEAVIEKMKKTGEITSEEHAENLRKSEYGPFRDPYNVRNAGYVDAAFLAHPREVARREETKAKVRARNEKKK